MKKNYLFFLLLSKTQIFGMNPTDPQPTAALPDSSSIKQIIQNPVRSKSGIQPMIPDVNDQR